MAIIEEIIEQEVPKVSPKAEQSKPTPAQSDQNDNKKDNSSAPLSNDNRAVADEEDDLFFDCEEHQPEELKRLIEEANEYKTLGNQAFASSEFEKAIGEYENALVVSPLSQKKDRAIYFANIAACHLKLGKPKDARDMCTRAIELDPEYTKALLRRAQANEKIGSYTALSEALEDYKTLVKTPNLDAYTRKECTRAERTLPDIIKVQMEKEKDEMMGKLKDLGNTLLGKFGLSTNNFQFQQDPNSGGYSMNFVNGDNNQPSKSS